jgi:sodium-dependent dicarboxylate transporter 2/3/5
MTWRLNTPRHIVGLVLGIALFLIVLLMPTPEGMTAPAQRTAAITLLMVCFWISEAIPIPATALIPLALFPLLGVLNSKAAAAPYANHNIFLFLGGFCIAMAMQKWDLHRRMALHIINAAGSKPRQIVLGFMAATAFLSMWISNTATTMMMLPIGMALIPHFAGENTGGKSSNFGMALMLGIAYSASVGGMGTLIGTPPNIVFAGQIKMLFPEAPEIGFFQWMLVGVPLALVLLPVIWIFLTGFAFPLKSTGPGIDNTIIAREISSLGPFKKGEKLTLAVFLATCFLWVFQKNITIGVLTIPGWADLLGIGKFVHDSTVAILAALVLFCLPVDLKKRVFVLDWESAEKLPWGILILFGGGFSLARGFMETGLSEWIGKSLIGAQGLPLVLIIACTCLLMTFLTELTSNTATASMILPVLAGIAGALHIHPFALMVPATLSASCAFMLPVATPPNAIVFGSGQLTIPDMARTGLALNLFGAVAITVLMYLVAVPVFGMVLSQAPVWVR